MFFKNKTNKKNRETGISAFKGPSHFDMNVTNQELNHLHISDIYSGDADIQSRTNLI